MALHHSQHHGQLPGPLTQLAATVLAAFLLQVLEIGKDYRQKLHNNGGVDVGRDTHGCDGELRQSATREHTHQLEESSCLQGLLPAHPVNTGDGNMYDQRENREAAEQPKNTAPEVRGLKGLEERG
jgi:hypothetical protein